jgi:hypothetical protein
MQYKKLNFCTLFDSNYLSRGYTMAESLVCSDPNCHLYIFAFDAQCEIVLKGLRHPRIHIIGLAEFEDEELLSIKRSRTPKEYCWTCTPYTVDYCLKNYGLEHCTYLDADIFFYSSPRVLLEEMESKSILITEHRYTPEYDDSCKSGIYCVQFVTFNADSNGLRALKWWKNACRDWCYSRVEDGKFGDQKYLDDWPRRFNGVHVLNHIGGGVAPWNVQQYDVIEQKCGIFVNHNQLKWPLVFFHFHRLKILRSGRFHCGPYRLEGRLKDIIYKPYCQQLIRNKRMLSDRHPNIKFTYDLDDCFIKQILCKKTRKRLLPSENIRDFAHG